MVRGLIRGVAVAGATAMIATLTASAPASAEWTRARDRGDVAGPLDIRWVKVAHTKRKVITTVKVRNFRPGTRHGLSVSYDIRGKRRGPEFGGAFVLRKPPREKLVKLRPNGSVAYEADCHRDRATVHFRRDRARYRVPRRCLKWPNRVRVYVSTVRRSGKAADYAPGNIKYTRWLQRG